MPYELKNIVLLDEQDEGKVVAEDPIPGAQVPGAGAVRYVEGGRGKFLKDGRAFFSTTGGGGGVLTKTERVPYWRSRGK